MTITKHETCPICGASIKIEMDDQAGKRFTALADRQIKRFLKIHDGCKRANKICGWVTVLITSPKQEIQASKEKYATRGKRTVNGRG